MKKLYFITGSQDLYGPITLSQVKEDSKQMVSYLNTCMSDIVEIEWLPTVTDRQSATLIFRKANADEDCVGCILWMHTFSPAKLWIEGLQENCKPLLHLHTQANEKLPYDKIDMDFMNLNQSAHGDREFSFILKRLAIPHQIVVGYYQHEAVIQKLRQFAEVSIAIDYSKNIRIAMFGNNMRDVAVTDGDRLESQIRYGWEASYYGIGDLVEIIQKVTNHEIDEKMKEYTSKYTISTNNVEAILEQARYEVALEKFLKETGNNAFTDTFQDLNGLDYLPGISAQNLMAKGIGFGPEGDYKTAALGAILFQMAKSREGATGFIEDYTYDLTENEEIELGAHMLEVSPVFASTKPKIEVYPLGIGGKNPPARLTFEGISGKGIQVSMLDLGDRFELVVADIELVQCPQKMPNLPVGAITWKILPTFEEGLRKWLESGAGHHSVVSTALTKEDIILFAKLTNTPITVIE